MLPATKRRLLILWTMQKDPFFDAIEDSFASQVQKVIGPHNYCAEPPMAKQCRRNQRPKNMSHITEEST